MIGREIIIYALRNIWKRKLRSFLTILSIFIGITTIFILVSFGLGLYNYVKEFSTSTSADKVMIQPKSLNPMGLDATFSLADRDLEAIKRAGGVYDATGVYIKPAEIRQGNKIRYAFLIGYDPKKPLVMEISNVKVFKGRELRNGDTGKVLLGYSYLVPDKIFPKAYDVNDIIEVQGEKLRIVGFLEEIGNPGDDANIYVISDFIDNLYPNENNSYNWIIAKVDTTNIDNVVKNIEKNLRKERNLDEGEEDFFVQSFEDLLETYSKVLNAIIGFVILIALISVIVSAINTSNTMITSVLERIKEIGVMKSTGAKNSDIALIFLFESCFLGFVGGLLGVDLGIILTYIAKIILQNLGYGFLRPSYSPLLLFGCILFAILTGAISGTIPAINASRIKPSEALRYE